MSRRRTQHPEPDPHLKADASDGAEGSGGPGQTKPCASCGRAIEWRKKWAKDWASVRYCSAACRGRKQRPVDLALEAAIRSLLQARGPTASICPSEAARAVDPAGWRDLMEPARRAARRLVAQGQAQITQGGRAVDPSTAKGPIRVRPAPRG